MGIHRLPSRCGNTSPQLTSQYRPPRLVRDKPHEQAFRPRLVNQLFAGSEADRAFPRLPLLWRLTGAGSNPLEQHGHNNNIVHSHPVLNGSIEVSFLNGGYGFRGPVSYTHLSCARRVDGTGLGALSCKIAPHLDNVVRNHA